MPRRRNPHKAAFNAAVRAMDARRGLGAPVRDAFFRCELDGEQRHPLARLMNSRSSGSGGGRGGRTRVALYLSLLWVAGGYPHETQRPARFWAELLGLPDPENAGSRVIRSTWSELASRNLVAVTPGGYTGDVPTIRPLREDGSRRAYTIPEGRGGDTYRRVPESAWRQLFHDTDLTGAGLAMYLVALRTAQQTGRTHGLTFPPSYFKEQYGLGESTRKTGLANLVDLGVLDVHIERIDDTGEGVERLRRRNVYDLLDEYARPSAAPERPSDRPLVGNPGIDPNVRS